MREEDQEYIDSLTIDERLALKVKLEDAVKTAETALRQCERDPRLALLNARKDQQAAFLRDNRHLIDEVAEAVHMTREQLCEYLEIEA